ASHSGNIARFTNADYDRLMADTAGQTDRKVLNEDYNRAEQILAEQAPIAPIYQYTNGRLIKPWVKGYPIANPEDVAYSQTLYILKH
ncbi:oligopeptide ABC transporter substrate-binding protein OppA, partial [Pectobacterium versatile]|nr:oligopeptide ABC transporter substrate-binding protein OppA [Pectobacterium versatile]